MDGKSGRLRKWIWEQAGMRAREGVKRVGRLTRRAAAVLSTKPTRKTNLQDMSANAEGLNLTSSSQERLAARQRSSQEPWPPDSMPAA
ncbi:hypothetical protein BaRGS_00014580 [Batillaria attramentaria]|uniref:Uncharacterized protein n=1 Tax=Batillaria attramentaria TaxID=370345 RepID=A0ABD0L438_9CAEN